ncbi:MAG: ankyrin repeat domain-containing protein [Ktedonobacterales bacterium]
MSDGDDIITAARAGDAGGVSALLDSDPSLANVANDAGETPLIVAIYSGARDVVSMLLARGAAANLFESAAMGDTPTIHAMLTANPALVNSYSYDGWTALHLAAHFGQTATARALVEQGADIALRSRNPLDNLPLHAAVAGGDHAELVRLLLEHGANPNATQHGGYTPLHETAQNGFLVATRLLLAAGADPNVRTNEGRSARELAEEQGHTEISALL